MMKLIPVMQVGARNQEMAYWVVYGLKSRLVADCVPVFSTDGLKHYFYALTAHFGKWEAADGKKPVRVLLGEFIEAITAEARAAQGIPVKVINPIT
jgi:L-ascorbate metabolism protein UlaG (beta-lactamase superfamily)